MTAVEQFWKDVQDILPSSVDTETGIKLVRAYEQAKEMEKEQKIALLKLLVYSVCIGDDVEDVEEWLKEHELNK